MFEQPFSPEELSRLVQRSKEGDTEAFGAIYDGYLTPVYRYVVFRFPEELAEDLVADIFVRAWEKMHTYTAYRGIPFSAWLFRIARHALIDAYRTQRGFEEISEDIQDEDTWNDPHQSTERALTVATVRRALSRMPAYYRDILLLHYVSGLSHREVANSLGITEGFVRVLKHRALKKLEAYLPPPEPRP